MKARKLPELPLPGDESIVIGKPYTILTVDDFESEVQHFEGWRVTLEEEKGFKVAIPLWYGETVSRKSRMGSFMVELGNDPEKWIGKIIKFVSWTERNRVVEVVSK